MLRSFLTMALVAGSIASQAQHKVTIKTTITGMKAGEWVYIYNNLIRSHKDSVQTTAGGFSAVINIPDGKADLYVIQIGHEPEYQRYNFLYLDKGTITIKGPGPYFTDAKVTGGSKANTDLAAYNSYIENAPLLKGGDSIYRKVSQLYNSKDTTGLAAYKVKRNRLDSINKELSANWIKAHKSSPASAYILSAYIQGLSLHEQDVILKQLTPEARNNNPAKRIAYTIHIDSITGIGHTAMNFTQADTLGKPVSLSDFRGKYVLVDFWASWCEPCRAESPNVVAAYNKHRNRNFTILGVSLDGESTKAAWLTAIHKDSLTWTQVSDLKGWENKVAQLYDISSIPANLLLDPNGVIVAKDLHGNELDEKLNEVLKTL